MRAIALLTDFGTVDYYVASVKGVLLSRAPHALPVDLGHEIAPGDVAAAAFLAVVDPGVGSERRILAAECDERWFVAPDNGLLSPILDRATVRAVERPDLYRDGPGHTFHGRDRFAPVAAYLARRASADDLGPVIHDAQRLDLPAPSAEAGVLRGRIVHVDRFGNLVSDVPGHWLGDPGRRWQASVGGQRCRRRVTHYAELEPGVAGMLVGSLGTVELSLAGTSLAQAWSVERGARLVLEAVDDVRHCD